MSLSNYDKASIVALRCAADRFLEKHGDALRSYYDKNANAFHEEMLALDSRFGTKRFKISYEVLYAAMKAVWIEKVSMNEIRDKNMKSEFPVLQHLDRHLHF